MLPHLAKLVLVLLGIAGVAVLAAVVIVVLLLAGFRAAAGALAYLDDAEDEEVTADV